LKQKRGFPVVSRHAQNHPTEVSQKLAGITVHGAKKLHSNGLEDVLVFQCAVLRDLAGGGQFGNSIGGGGCRLQVGVGQWADDRHIPAKGFAFLPWDYYYYYYYYYYLLLLNEYN